MAIFEEIKMRVEKICRLCPHSKGINCLLLNMSLGAAAISEDCPFEDLTGNESFEVIQDAINKWKIAKDLIESFNDM